MALIYTRITMTIPGVGSAIHIAELEELNRESCAMKRMIALDPADVVMGIATPEGTKGAVEKPLSTVPHPDTYGNFPDIEAQELSAEEFEGLWLEAQNKFTSAM